MIRRAWLSVLLLTMALAPLSCARKPDPGTVVMIIESSPANLDPRVGTDAQSERIADLICDSLVRRDEHFQMQPWLARSWEISSDGRTYTFHLREGIHFHNGALLTSRDVKWTVDSILNGTVISPKKGSFPQLASVEAPDPLTVVFHLKQPDSGLLFNLSNGSLGIVPYGSGKELAAHLIGSGPFKFVSAAQDDYVLVERNADYWAGAPRVERVRFAVIPDTTTRVLELRKGSADIEINAITPDMTDTIRSGGSGGRAGADSGGLVVEQGPGTSYQYVALNLRATALKDVRVRQAIAYAVDVQPIIHYLMRDLARPADSVLPPQHWAYAPAARYPHDVTKAEALLEAAGYPRDPRTGVRLRLTMKTSTEESVRLLGAILQQQLRAAGIELDLRTFEFATFYSDIQKGSFELYSLRWVGGSNQDPDIFSYAFDSARVPPNGANRGYFSDPQVDALLRHARSITDQDSRRADYARVQQIIAGEVPYVNLWYMDNVIVHTRRVKNIQVSPAGNYEFLRDVELAQ